MTNINLDPLLKSLAEQGFRGMILLKPDETTQVHATDPAVGVRSRVLGIGDAMQISLTWDLPDGEQESMEIKIDPSWERAPTSRHLFPEQVHLENGDQLSLKYTLTEEEAYDRRMGVPHEPRPAADTAAIVAFVEEDR